jgi:uncharacterized protein YbjT (DUF2867 family)
LRCDAGSRHGLPETVRMSLGTPEYFEQKADGATCRRHQRYLPGMKVIVTGVTGMVGEGVLLECLENPAVERVLSVSRRPSGHAHPKLTECLVRDFRNLAGAEPQLTGYDACFYCAGVSSVGMKEAEYAAITYDTPLAFAQTLSRLNPGMVLVHVTGAHTDGSEQGKVMWARVKGKAENALGRLPFKAVYNFRPSLMKPAPGQKNIKRSYQVGLVLYPLLKLFFPALSLRQVGLAMINCVRYGAPKGVLEAKDIEAQAERSIAGAGEA